MIPTNQPDPLYAYSNDRGYVPFPGEAQFIRPFLDFLKETGSDKLHLHSVLPSYFEEVAKEHLQHIRHLKIEYIQFAGDWTLTRFLPNLESLEIGYFGPPLQPLDLTWWPRLTLLNCSWSKNLHNISRVHLQQVCFNTQSQHVKQFSDYGLPVSVRKLLLSDVSVGSFDGIEHLQHLEELELSQVKRCKDFSKISQCKSLKKIVIGHTRITANQMPTPPNAEYFALGVSKLDHIRFITDMPKLRYFACSAKVTEADESVVSNNNWDFLHLPSIGRLK